MDLDRVFFRTAGFLEREGNRFFFLARLLHQPTRTRLAQISISMEISTSALPCVVAVNCCLACCDAVGRSPLDVCKVWGTCLVNLSLCVLKVGFRL